MLLLRFCALSKIRDPLKKKKVCFARSEFPSSEAGSIIPEVLIMNTVLEF